jgi:hypothetical protein
MRAGISRSYEGLSGRCSWLDRSSLRNINAHVWGGIARALSCLADLVVERMHHRAEQGAQDAGPRDLELALKFGLGMPLRLAHWS